MVPKSVLDHQYSIFQAIKSQNMTMDFVPYTKESIEKAFHIVRNMTERERKKYAYAIYLDNRSDVYIQYALALIQSLKNVDSKFQVVVVSTNHFSISIEKLLKTIGVSNIYYFTNDLIHATTDKPKWDAAFMKLNIFRLVQYDKIVFLDTDTIVLQNMDELFGFDAPAATHEPCRGCAFVKGHSESINGGLYVIKPSLEYYKIVKNYVEFRNGVIPKGDQELLYFLWTTPPEKGGITSKFYQLPYIYNTTPDECNDSFILHFLEYGYRKRTIFQAAPKWNINDVKMVHFIYSPKPHSKLTIWLPNRCLGYPYAVFNRSLNDALRSLQMTKEDLKALLVHAS
jgi:hypothetical protein